MALTYPTCMLHTHYDHHNQQKKFCQTHGLEVGPHDYNCKVGQAINTLTSQAEHEIIKLQTRLTNMEALLDNEPVKNFLTHLRQMHEKGPSP